MPEPRSEWGRELVERAEQLAAKLETVAREVEKVDGIMNEIRQLSTDRNNLALAATRVEVQLTDVIKHLDQLTQDMKGFASFKTTGENLIWVVKWILSPPLILAFLGVSVVGLDIRSSVYQHSERISNLEKVTTKLQESTAENISAARTLAENVEKNTEATKQIVADMRKELKSLLPVRVEIAKSHEMTARFFLSQGAIQKKNKESIEFRWKLPHPIEKDKVEKTKVTARLAPSAAFEPSTGFANTDVQLRAGLTPEGQFCWLEIFSPRASQLADSLKGAVKVPVDVTFMLPD